VRLTERAWETEQNNQRLKKERTIPSERPLLQGKNLTEENDTPANPKKPSSPRINKPKARHPLPYKKKQAKKKTKLKQRENVGGKRYPKKPSSTAHLPRQGPSRKDNTGPYGDPAAGEKKNLKRTPPLQKPRKNHNVGSTSENQRGGQWVSDKEKKITECRKRQKRNRRPTQRKPKNTTSNSKTDKDETAGGGALSELMWNVGGGGKKT